VVKSLLKLLLLRLLLKLLLLRLLLRLLPKPLLLRLLTLLLPLLLPSNRLLRSSKKPTQVGFFVAWNSADQPPVQPRLLTRHPHPLLSTPQHRRQRSDGQFGSIVLPTQMRRHQMLQSPLSDPIQ